jgi:hypothetical protein
MVALGTQAMPWELSSQSILLAFRGWFAITPGDVDFWPQN